ncbi:MAG: hypothetical protein GY938_08925 [Ketobacter sp.]|nr:hypothetical protein [Ketobacter sp.]
MGTPNNNVDGRLVNLPKIDLPRFDGRMTEFAHWWEAFRIGVHEAIELTPL